jgi:uncharacterized protein (DUF362 family)
MSDVFVTKVTNPKGSISWLLEKIVLPNKPQKICIKANLNDYRKWETASTCDPVILDALLSTLRDKFPDASITVIEGDATGVNADNIFEYLGIDTIVHKNNCDFINVSRKNWISVDIDGLYFKKLDVPEILHSCDFFITLPKLKSHVKTKMTCGLKNQMGLFRPKRKIEYHHVLDELIVDCNLAMRPHLSIVDANLVMEGTYGPAYGTPRKLGLLVGSNDVVSADSFCSRLFGLNANSVTHIKKAAKKRLGETKFKLVPDFDFAYNDFKLAFNPLLFYMIRKVANGLKR